MTAKSTRRAVLAGAAALPALSLPAVSAETDPIFAAIEKHKVAFRLEQKTARAECYVSSKAPEYEAIADAANKALAASAEAAYDLADLQPTTMAGVLALLEYVEEFNAGKFVLEETAALSRLKQWRSGAGDWPPCDDENEESELDTFGFEILANVREALKALAVQS